MRARSLVLSFVCAAPALTGDLDGNPLLTASSRLGATGTAPGATSQKAAGFRQAGRRIHLDRFLLSVSDDPEQRAAFKQALEQVLEGHEQQAKAGGYADDAAGALAFAVAVLQVTLTGQELPDEVFPALLGQLRAALDQPGVQAATDEQKQTYYEACLYYGGTILTLSGAGAEAEQVKTLASAWLEELLGAPAARVSLGAKGLSISGPAKAPPAGTPSKPTAGAKGLAEGFAHSLPAGWTEEGGWCIGRQRENRGYSEEITSALVRFLPAIPAQGNMGDALRATWKASAPPELVDKVSGMVYRRYLGEELFAQFVIGQGREKGRLADTLCTLYLIDCGATWQPVLVAQTYEEPNNQIGASVTQAGHLSFPRSAELAEAFLAGLRCPAGKGRGRPIVDPAALAGEYQFGSSSSLQWVNVHTGSTSMTIVSYGGDLHLKPDGTFDYSFQSASGEVGRTQFASKKDHGTWKLEGDLLILTGQDGKLTRRKVAGLTQFPDGVKAAILLFHADRVANPVTVTDGADIHSTKK